MLCNITNFAPNELRELRFTHKFEVPHSYHIIDNSVLAVIEGTLSVSSNGMFLFEGNITYDVHYICGMCLEHAITKIGIDFSERFSETSSDDDEIWSINDKIIDITEPIRTCILLNLPVKILCKDDCKGLCTSCGINLNLENCNCDTSDIDPRWESLRSLLQEKEV